MKTNNLKRYSKIEEKTKREIVLLKAKPCKWGKCTFCDYIEDNETDDEIIERINFETLKKVTGEFKVLEVINSASVFDFTKNSLSMIKKVMEEKISRGYF